MKSIPRWHSEAARGIVKRIVVEGELTLLSPAHLGNGDETDSTDMPLLTDAEGNPILTGTALAGALRAYLRQREHGWRVPEQKGFLSEVLCGGLPGQDDGEQSTLIVEDCYGSVPEGNGSGIDVRYGNRINPVSHTVEHQALFDWEVWEPGVSFPIRFELLILDPALEWAVPEDKLRLALVTALTGLQEKPGGITLGARKRRGFGRIQSSNWRVREFDLLNPRDLVDWVLFGRDALPLPAQATLSIENVLNAKPIPDQRRTFTLEARFLVSSDPVENRTGSLMIRSGGRTDAGPDLVHIHSRTPDGSRAPVVPGTGLGGLLRARSRKILNTLFADSNLPSHTEEFISNLFGPDLQTERLTPFAGRVAIEEHLLNNARTDLVQNRNGIDLFTGGTRDTALFNEQPAFSQSGGTTLLLKLQLESPQDFEVGLLIHVVKDLWTSDLPVGGETGIGRGRLRGDSVDITNGTETWHIRQTPTGLEIGGGTERLEAFASTLWEICGGK